MDSNHIFYNKKEYPTREIYLNGYSKSGEFWHGEYKISVESLNQKIEEGLDMPVDSIERSKAYCMDQFILFYVPDKLIDAGDEEVSRYIMDNL